MHRFMYLRFLCVLGVGLALFAPVRAAEATADQTLTAAKQLLDLQQDQQAAVELQKFITNFPKDPRLPNVAYSLGRCYQRLGKPEKAAPMFAKVIANTKSPKDNTLRGEAYYQLGDCAFAEKKHEKAAQYYAEALKLIAKDPDLTARANYWMAESLYQLESYDQALKAYRQVAAVAPQHNLAAWSIYSIGMIEMHDEHYDQAITDLERVTTAYKKSEVVGEASMALGFAYTARAQVDTNPAMRDADYRKAVRIFTDMLGDEKVTQTAKQRAQLAMAQAYFNLKDYAKTETTCAQALESMDIASPPAIRLTLWRGHALYNSNRYREAAAEYAKVADSKLPDMVNEGLYWLGSSWYQQAEEKKDVKACNEAVSAFARFLTAVDAKHPQAARAALMQAYCLEDLTTVGDAGARAKTIVAYKAILEKWPSTREAAQAQEGIARLSATMSADELKTLAGTLPAGSASWNVALRLAREEFQAEKYDAAIADARKVLDGTPTAEVKAQASYLIGAALQKTGKPTEAIASFKQVMTSAPNGELAVFAQRGLAQAHLDLKNYVEARDAALALTKMALSDKEAAEAQMYLADAYFGNQQTAEAQVCYQKIATAYPNSPLVPYALIHVAWIAETKKDFDLAITAYRDFLAKFPDHELVPQAFYRLGADLTEKKDYANAVQAFKNVPKTHPLADQAAYAIAWAYKDLGKQEEAIAQFNVVADEFSDSPLAADSLFRLGEYWLEQKRYSDAMRYYSRAADKAGQSSLASLTLYKLGVCSYRAEQYAVAANAFGKLEANFPTNTYVAEGLFWRGQALEKQGQDAAAREVYLRYLAKFPKQALAIDAAVGAGRTGLRAKQYPDARADLEKTLQLCADATKGTDTALTDRAKNVAPEAQFDLAQCYYEEKNYQEALKQFAGVSAYPYEPWYSRSLLQAALCNLQLGDRQTAKNSLQLLLHNFPKSDAAKEVAKIVKEYGLDMGPAM